MKQVKILKSLENEIAVEVMEQAIVDIAVGFRKLSASRLTKRAIIVLIQDSITPPMPKKDVEAVLDAADNLANRYLKK